MKKYSRMNFLKDYIKQKLNYKKELEIVCNTLNTSEVSFPKGYTRWIDYWLDKNKKVEEPKFCPSCGEELTDKNICGGHVTRIASSGRFLLFPKVVIIPLCDSCNNKKEKLPPFIVNSRFMVDAPNSSEIFKDSYANKKNKYIPNQKYIMAIHKYIGSTVKKEDFEKYIECWKKILNK